MLIIDISNKYVLLHECLIGSNTEHNTKLKLFSMKHEKKCDLVCSSPSSSNAFITQLTNTTTAVKEEKKRRKTALLIVSINHRERVSARTIRIFNSLGYPEDARNARLNRERGGMPLTPLPNNHLPIPIEQFSTKGESPRRREEESRPAWQRFRVFRARVGPRS